MTSHNNLISSWVANGEAVSIRLFAPFLHENIKDAFLQAKIPFFCNRKNGRSVFVIRERDKEAADTAAKRAVEAKQEPNMAYHSEYFDEAMRSRKKEVFYLGNLSEVEKEAMEDQISEHGCGIHYSVSRRTDDTWIMGFDTDDVYADAGKLIQNDILQFYLRAMFLLYGPMGLEMKKKYRRKAAMRRMLAEISFPELPDYFPEYLYDGKRGLHIARGVMQPVTVRFSGREMKMAEGKPDMLADPSAHAKFRTYLAQMPDIDSAVDKERFIKAERKMESRGASAKDRSSGKTLYGGLNVLRAFRQIFDSHHPEFTGGDIRQTVLQAIGEWKETVADLGGEGRFCPLYTVTEQEMLLRAFSRAGLEPASLNGMSEKSGRVRFEVKVPEHDRRNIAAALRSGREEGRNELSAMAGKSR